MLNHITGDKPHQVHQSSSVHELSSQSLTRMLLMLMMMGQGVVLDADPIRLPEFAPADPSGALLKHLLRAWTIQDDE